MSTTAVARPMTPEEKKVIFASSLGTVFEWYDFYLYGSLAAIIAKQFFSGLDAGSAFIFALLAFAAGFIVRPFGAIFFGRLGDMIGRKYTFLVTILIMGLSTFIVGILPTYASIGVAAPIILIVLRLLQGLALGGEYGGAATYVAEHSPQGKRGAYTSWIQTTATLGLFLSLMVILGTRTVIGEAAFADWGWRVPFIVSILLLAISVWIRLSMNESPAFAKMKAEGKTSKAPLSESFGQWKNLKIVILALVGLTAGQAVVWYTGQFYALFFLTQALKVDGPIERPFTLPMPDLKGHAVKLAVIERALGKRLPEGATVDVRAVRLALKVGGENVGLGPGPLTLVRRPEGVHVSFSTEKDAQGTQLSISADLPIDKGDTRVELTGGPVSLAQLGVSEGSLGLADVGRATLAGRGQLVLSDGGESLTFDLQLKTRGITITQPRVANETIRGLDLDVGARGLLTASGALRLDHADLEVGQLRAAAHGTVVQEPDHLNVSLTADAYTATCQGIVDSLPHALVPTIKNAKVAGTFGGHGRLVFDTRRIDDLVLDYHVDSSCRLTEVPVDLARERFRRPFRHRVYAPDGTQHEETTGPGSPNWTDLDHISPYMQVAVMTTEDGGFYKHHGFNHPAFRNSLVANLKAGRFVRGASTISMQLAKNLFLFRDKTLARKLEELVLTDYLEQVFGKEEMMELYLNVIEFGPNVYGITKAADHYFGRKPEELTLSESMFLSTLLPSPIRFHHIYDHGQVPDAWMSHLHTLLGIAEKTHRISPRELDEGKKQAVVFWKPGTPRPAPRPPITARYGDGDEASWEPVD